MFETFHSQQRLNFEDEEGLTDVYTPVCGIVVIDIFYLLLIIRKHAHNTSFGGFIASLWPHYLAYVAPKLSGQKLIT